MIDYYYKMIFHDIVCFFVIYIYLFNVLNFYIITRFTTFCVKNISITYKKKVEWTLHVSILPLWILSRWIRIRSQNFAWTPQFFPRLGEMREILEISVFVKEILIYAILNKTRMFSRISSRLVQISL